MTPEFVIGLGRQALEIMLEISLPVLMLSLIVGIIISIFQTVTQIQEATITFVPKIVVTFVSLLLFGGWMISKITDFTRYVLENFPNWIK